MKTLCAAEMRIHIDHLTKAIEKVDRTRHAISGKTEVPWEHWSDLASAQGWLTAVRNGLLDAAIGDVEVETRELV